MRRAWLVTLLLSGIANCCGGGGGGAPPAASDLAATLAKAFCAQQVACGATAKQTTCEASTFVTDQTVLTAIADVELGTVVYHPERVDQCLHDAFPPDCVVNLGMPPPLPATVYSRLRKEAHASSTSSAPAKVIA